MSVEHYNKKHVDVKGNLVTVSKLRVILIYCTYRTKIIFEAILTPKSSDIKWFKIVI